VKSTIDVTESLGVWPMDNAFTDGLYCEGLLVLH
jgi:hypothetical protein